LFLFDFDIKKGRRVCLYFLSFGKRPGDLITKSHLVLDGISFSSSIHSSVSTGVRALVSHLVMRRTLLQSAKPKNEGWGEPGVPGLQMLRNLPS
jgi:hypothetical protein